MGNYLIPMIPFNDQYIIQSVFSLNESQMYCNRCRKRHLVAFSCKGWGFCPNCLGRRMNEGVDWFVARASGKTVPRGSYIVRATDGKHTVARTYALQ